MLYYSLTFRKIQTGNNFSGVGPCKYFEILSCHPKYPSFLKKTLVIASCPVPLKHEAKVKNCQNQNTTYGHQSQESVKIWQ